MADNKIFGNVTELVCHLKQRAVKHRTLYHYTNLSGALGILKSGYIHLSSIQSKNDKTEIFHGQESERENVFSFSFAHGAKENMSLWGLYSIPWSEGVRLDFKTAAVELLTSSEIYCARDELRIGYDPLVSRAPEISLVDVAYCFENKNGTFSLRGINVEGDIDITTDPRLIGYIKQDAWQYENETRIRVHIDNTDNHALVALKLPEDILNSLRVTAAPWFSGDLKSILREELGRDIDVGASSFTNLVDYRDHCYYCAKKPFELAETKIIQTAII